MARLQFTEEETAARIDALLRADDYGLSHWSSYNGEQVTFTYRFETSKAADFPWTNVGNTTGFTEAEKSAIRSALQEYNKHININFVEDNSSQDAVLSFYKADDLYTDLSVTGGGRGRGSYSGDDWDGAAVFNANRDLSSQSEFDLVLHEIGHTLGLKHPGDYDRGGNNPAGPFLPADEDNERWTVMSYNPDPSTDIEPDRLKFYDIMALQQFWGTNNGNQDSAQNVMRFYNTKTETHFYTANADERDQVLAYLEDYIFEGNMFDTNATAESGIAVYRFLNQSTGTHFYTAAEAERDSVLENLPSYLFEGVAYHAYETADAGETALFRFYNTQNGTHFYTASEAERDYVINTLGHLNYEGVAYYVDMA
ncbi:matrixin family metalloprotease [Roseibium alexandrii]|nr:matrixin family metalloprotease [Roseibium alexandrii]